MSMKDVFIIREGDIIDFEKEKDARTLPMGDYVDKYHDDIDNEELSLDDYTGGPFPFEDYTPEQQNRFIEIYRQRHPDGRPLGYEGWNAIHAELDAEIEKQADVQNRRSMFKSIPGDKK